MEALAALLAARLSVALPFVERTVGLARLYTTSTEADGPIKLPVPVTFTADDCERNTRYLVPDPMTSGILFFEDGGTVPVGAPALRIKQSSLRLLLWVNPARLDGELSEAALLAAVEKALKVNERYAAGDFLDIFTTYTTLPAEASLFSRYTFDGIRSLLLPPYRVLGLDLKVQFRLANRCFTDPLPGLKDYAPC
jgi:hypothetical protein